WEETIGVTRGELIARWRNHAAQHFVVLCDEVERLQAAETSQASAFFELKNKYGQVRAKLDKLKAQVAKGKHLTDPGLPRLRGKTISDLQRTITKHKKVVKGLRAKIARLENNARMACETPPGDCEC